MFNALVALLLPSKAAKVFKPSAVDTSVFALLSRLISQVEQFPRGRLPDLSRLEWLADRMTARHAEEVKHLGRETAVSRPLQSIINLVLQLRQAQAKLAKLKAASSSSSSSSSSSYSLGASPASLSLSLLPDSSIDSSDPTDIGPDESAMSWFDVTRQTSELMRCIQSGAGVPASFIRLAWLDMQIQKMSVVGESEHPYTRDRQWTEISIPQAQQLTVRLDAKCKTDASDKLRFAVLTTEMATQSQSQSQSQSSSLPLPLSGPVKDSDLTEVASFSGSEMSKGGVGAMVAKGGQCVDLKGYSRVFYCFEQSNSPVHANVFCSACAFPIKGVRLICTHCDGSDDTNGRHRRRHHDRADGYALCVACENSNQDTNKVRGGWIGEGLEVCTGVGWTAEPV